MLNTRKKIKSVGILCAAMLMATALFCVGAPGASAAGPVGIQIVGEGSEEEGNLPRFGAESFPVTIDGESLSTHEFVFQAGTIFCQTNEFFGEAIEEESTTLEFSPYYLPAFCYATALKRPVQLAFYGCGYLMHVLNAGPPYAGSLDIDCPTEQGMTFIVKNSSDEVICTETLLPQAGIEGIDFENTGEGSESSVLANLELTGIEYTQEGTLCKDGEFADGVYNGEERLRGEEE